MQIWLDMEIVVCENWCGFMWFGMMSIRCLIKVLCGNWAVEVIAVAAVVVQCCDEWLKAVQFFCVSIAVAINLWIFGI